MTKSMCVSAPPLHLDITIHDNVVEQHHKSFLSLESPFLQHITRLYIPTADKPVDVAFIATHFTHLTHLAVRYSEPQLDELSEMLGYARNLPFLQQIVIITLPGHGNTRKTVTSLKHVPSGPHAKDSALVSVSHYFTDCVKLTSHSNSPDFAPCPRSPLPLILCRWPPTAHKLLPSAGNLAITNL